MTTTEDIDRWRPFCGPSWLMGCRTKPVFKLEGEVGESNTYMKFGRYPIKND